MRPQPLRASAEMNITPLIDVLLVLLVIFLAAAQSVPDNFDPPPDTIVIEYNAERHLSINHQAVLMANLEDRLRGVYAAGCSS
jgi:biopolymer transport protein ExbD